MPVKLRLFLFYFFVCLFFVLLPVFLLFSLGYRMNFSTHHLERMGMIAIRTIPDEASIILNNKLLRQKTPAHFSNLFPGKYSITLSHSGYRPWEGKVEVRPNWVTRLESVILFPTNVTFYPVTDLVAYRFFLSPKARKMILVAESNEDRGLWFLDLFSDEETLILDEHEFVERQLGSFSGMKDLEIHWSRDEKAVLIEKEKRFFLLNLKRPNRMISLKDLLGFEPDQVAWSSKSTDSFYYLRQGNVGKYNYQKKKKEESVFKNAEGFCYQNGFLLYIDKETGDIWRLSEDSYEKVLIARIPEFTPQSGYEIVMDTVSDLISPHGHVGVMKDQNIFYELNNAPRKFEGVTEVLFNKAGKQLFLIEKGKGIVLAKSQSQNEGDSKTELVNIPEETRRIFWFDNSKLIFVSRRGAFIRQLGVDTDAYTQEMFTFPFGWQDIYWDARFHQLYLIEFRSGKEGGNLVRVNLAQGPLSKLMQNMRETMAEGMQLIYEVGKK